MHTQVFTHSVIPATAGLGQRFVAFDGSPADADAPVLGVARDDYRADEAVAVDVLGVVAVESGGAIALGGWVVSDAEGRAVANDGTSALRVGRALQAVSGAGQTVLIFIR